MCKPYMPGTFCIGESCNYLLKALKGTAVCFLNKNK